MKKLIVLILFLSHLDLMSHSITRADEDPRIFSKFNLSTIGSKFYKSQFNFSSRLINGEGAIRNTYLSALAFDYGYRIGSDNKVDQKYRFALGGYTGLFNSRLFKYKRDPFGTEKSCYYLYNCFGFNLLDYSTLEEFSEFKMIKLTTEFTLEKRRDTYNYNVYNRRGTPKHNFYLYPKFSAGVSYYDFEKSLYNIPKGELALYFWDTPLELNIEFGYEWKIGADIDFLTNGKFQSLLCISSFYNIDYMPLEDFKIMSYGAIFSFEIENSLVEFLNQYSLNFKYEKEEFLLNDLSIKNDKYSIELVIPIYKYF